MHRFARNGHAVWVDIFESHLLKFINFFNNLLTNRWMP